MVYTMVRLDTDRLSRGVESEGTYRDGSVATYLRSIDLIPKRRSTTLCLYGYIAMSRS